MFQAMHGVHKHTENLSKVFFTFLFVNKDKPSTDE